jgi:hypothetical protein
LDVRDVRKEFLDGDDDEELLGGGKGREEEEEQEDERRRRERESNSSDTDRGGWRSAMDKGAVYPGNARMEREARARSYSPATTTNHRRPLNHSSLFSPGLHHSFTPPLTSQLASPFLFDASRFHSYDERPSKYNQNDIDDDYSPRFPAASSPSSIPSSHPRKPAPIHSASASSQPSMQLHLKVVYSGNLQLGLTTSLLINYPSSMFMSLPLKLSVTALAFSGTFIVAFEGEKRRIHISLLDPKDDEESAGPGGESTATGFLQSPVPTWTKEGILSAGGRLLSNAVVDSEVGQTDKHVLKNVGKVEKFVLDVMRSTLESELVFP